MKYGVLKEEEPFMMIREGSLCTVLPQRKAERGTRYIRVRFVNSRYPDGYNEAVILPEAIEEVTKEVFDIMLAVS
jgi:hypothetical protein